MFMDQGTITEQRRRWETAEDVHFWAYLHNYGVTGWPGRSCCLIYIVGMVL